MEAQYVDAGIGLLSYFYSQARYVDAYFSLLPPLSTLLHTLLHTCNSCILLSTLNFSSVPVWKGRALPSPPLTSSQIPHQWAPTESRARGPAFLKQFIKRSNYCRSGFLTQGELWKTMLSDGKLPFMQLPQQGCTVPLRLKNIFRVRLGTFKRVSNFVTAELFPNIANRKCPVSSPIPRCCKQFGKKKESQIPDSVNIHQ